MDELKLCPFCAGKAFLYLMYNKNIKVSCENDCVTMPPRFDMGFTSEEAAIKAWNTRVGKELKD